MRKRVAVVAALWLAGAVVAAIGVTAALSFLSAGMFAPGGRLMSQADVQRELAQHPAAGPLSGQPGSNPATAAGGSPSPTPRPAPGQASAPRELRTTGGTVIASCSAGKVWLRSWFAAPGYQIDGAFRGPATSAWVKFSSGGTELRVTAMCSGGHPTATSAADDKAGEHGGGAPGGGAPGGDNRGGGGGGGGSGTSGSSGSSGSGKGGGDG